MVFLSILWQGISDCGWRAPMFDEKSLSRFNSRFAAGDPNECWMWQGFRNPAGYGTFCFRGAMIIASRMALSIKLGRMVQHPLMACHTCDNPSCVNPAHLWEGTRSDNVKDAIRKGRMKFKPIPVETHVSGEDHPFSKLTDADVRAIRASDLSHAELGRAYGVSRTNIGYIRSRKTWQHVS